MLSSWLPQLPPLPSLPFWSTARTLPRRVRNRVRGEVFDFLDHPPLVDRELELVLTDHRWIDDYLASAHHPTTISGMPREAETTRDGLEEFLKHAPLGHERPNPQRGRANAYHFWMRLLPEYDPPLKMAGGIGLRIGQTQDLEMYLGHIGYHVFPAARGHHYSERACRLLFSVARQHGFRDLWITVNPDNLPSRRTCERLGGILVGEVELPTDHSLYKRGDRRKCRYRINIVAG